MEIAFRSKLALIAPIVLVPILVLAFTSSEPKYQSVATVWVTKAPEDQPSLGHADPWRTPAQNRAVALNDLLATRAFKLAVFQRAGVIPEEADPDVRLDPRIRLWAGSTGVNLLQIGAISGSGELSARLVQAVIDEYLDRATAESERGINATAEYLGRQLESARRELDERRSRLNEYVAQHPELTDPRNAAADIDYQALITAVDTQSGVVQNLENQLQATELQRAAGPDAQNAAFSVQDPPSQPRVPLPESKAKRYGMPLAGLVFGALISGAYLLVRYRSDHTILSSEDLAGMEVPTLGAVPELTPPGLLARVPLVSVLVRLRSPGYARSTARNIGSTPTEEAT